MTSTIPTNQEVSVPPFILWHYMMAWFDQQINATEYELYTGQPAPRITIVPPLQGIAVSLIKAGDNDRLAFKEGDLLGLAQSIKESGLAELIVLRPTDDPAFDFEIVAGERRFRALKLLGYTHLMLGAHCRIMELSDQKASALMLVENVMRVNLSPVEEAKAYQKRLDEGWTIEDIVIRCGVSATIVLFRLKLLKLREDIQRLVSTGDLQLGYAQILADADLDRNRQLIAIRLFQEHKNPTTGWFRLQVNKLADQQHQEVLFKEAFSPPELLLTSPDLPADPRTDSAPTDGDDWLQVVESHVAFWEAQGAAWADLGKTFKKQECEAVIKALNTLLWAIEPVLEEEIGG